VGDACYCSVSCLISKTFKIGIYKTIILHFVLYECETCSLTIREERRLKVFENRVLRRMFVRERKEQAGEYCIMRNFITCTHTFHQMLFG
jgi:hypothetical protein